MSPQPTNPTNPANHEKKLQVVICGSPAGELRELKSGALSFSYHAEYAGTPLSINMPISNVAYYDKAVRPFLFGLLPDSHDLRNSIARKHGISANNPFALLQVIGLDCPGAVQFCQEDQLASLANRPANYREISPEEIGARLELLSSAPAASWQTPFEHWSLGGQQGKIALAKFDNTWFECEEAAATTHIIKPGISFLFHQALNEHFCLTLAALCGVPAAKSSYERFGHQKALVVERFDRDIIRPFDVVRYHQEDFCQALGVLPEYKYADEGGPSVRNILELLSKLPDPAGAQTIFSAELFFNYLIGAPDAHAKNFSLFLAADGNASLTPLYDVASGLPYEPTREYKFAMSIGHENRFGKLRKSNIVRMAERSVLESQSLLDLMGNLASMVLEKLPEAAETVSSNLAKAEKEEQELIERLVVNIGNLCEKTLLQL